MQPRRALPSSLFDHHPDAIYSFDASGCFVSANAACEALTGYKIEEVAGRPFEPIVVPEHRALSRQHYLAAMSGSARSNEESIIHKSGRRVDIAITKLPIVVVTCGSAGSVTSCEKGLTSPSAV